MAKKDKSKRAKKLMKKAKKMMKKAKKMMKKANKKEKGSNTKVDRQDAPTTFPIFYVASASIRGISHKICEGQRRGEVQPTLG